MPTRHSSDSPQRTTKPFAVGPFLCHHNLEIEPFEQIERPATVDLKQETVLRVIESAPPDTTSDAPGCEALIERNEALARLKWVQARTDFYRQRRGRRGKPALRLTWETAGELGEDNASAQEQADREADLAHLRQRLADDGLARIGAELFEDVVAVMTEAQQVRTQGRGSGGMSAALRARITRLRKKTGLPLDTRLL